MLKCRETFEKFLAAYNSSKNTDLPIFFSTGFWQLYFKNINFLTKTKRCLLCWLMNSKLTKMTHKYKQNYTFQKSESYAYLVLKKYSSIRLQVSCCCRHTLSKICLLIHCIYIHIYIYIYIYMFIYNIYVCIYIRYSRK